MPRPLKRGILGPSKIILSKDIEFLKTCIHEAIINWKKIYPETLVHRPVHFGIKGLQLTLKISN